MRLSGRLLALWTAAAAAGFPLAGLVVWYYHLCPVGPLLERLYEAL